MNVLQTRLVADMKTAMKAGDKERLGTIRLMIAELKQAQLAQASDDMDEAGEQAVLRRMIKARRDAIEQARQVGRDDVAAREAAEVAVIEGYLPQLLRGEELAAKVREVAAEIGYQGPQDTGRFMKEWMARFRELAEGRDVQAALRALG
ncbi:MAG: GatB/YqeY domain-containing protein [Planctomycetes bacterium]|nr:GatB/YqeY domain-containing protein [Planctomycetota bacterium]